MLNRALVQPQSIHDHTASLEDIYARKWVPTTALFLVILAGTHVVPNVTYFIEDF